MFQGVAHWRRSGWWWAVEGTARNRVHPILTVPAKDGAQGLLHLCDDSCNGCTWIDAKRALVRGNTITLSCNQLWKSHSTSSTIYQLWLFSELAAKEGHERVARRWNCSCIGGMERGWVRRHSAGPGESVVCCNYAWVPPCCTTLMAWLQVTAIIFR